MEISEFRPPSGFWRFSWMVLSKRWGKVLVVPTVIEAIVSLAVFLVGVFVSKEASDALWAWVLAHPFVVLSPGWIGCLWLFVCESHREHANRTGKLKRKVRRVRMHAQDLIHDLADRNSQAERTKAAYTLHLKQAKEDFEEALREKDSEVKALKSLLDDRNAKRIAKEALGNMLAIGHQLENQSIQPSDLGEVAMWGIRIDEWVKTCHQQIESLLGTAEATSFGIYRGTWLNYQRADSSPMVNQHCNQIAWKLSALREMISRLGIV